MLFVSCIWLSHPKSWLHRWLHCGGECPPSTHILRMTLQFPPRRYLRKRADRNAMPRCAGECEKPLGSYLLQTHAAQQPPQPSDPEMTVDMNGRQCHLCSMPLPERSDRRYLQRTDCGNQSVFEHPENNRKPLISFSRQGSNAYCELNIQKWCADAMLGGVFRSDLT